MHDQLGFRSHQYDGSMIQVLEGREAVRLRPQMYIGATNQQGLHRLLEFLVDGLLSHYSALGQPLDQITVRLEEDGSATIISSMAVTSPTFLEQSAPELQRDFLRFGRIWSLFAVNALCERFSVTIREADHQWHTLMFEQGTLRSDKSHAISPPVSNCILWLRLWPDFTILEPDNFDDKQTRDLMRSLSSDHGVAITVIRERSSRSWPCA
jgi:DNA gyrase/topoisomerase IV subunit B